MKVLLLFPRHKGIRLIPRIMNFLSVKGRFYLVFEGNYERIFRELISFSGWENTVRVELIRGLGALDDFYQAPLLERRFLSVLKACVKSVYSVWPAACTEVSQT